MAERAGRSWLSRLRALAGAAATLAAAVGYDAIRADCPEGNLVARDDVRVHPAMARVVADDRFAPEGGTRGAVRLEVPLVIDLGTARTVRALLVQAAAEDRLRLDGSLDAAAWTPFAELPAVQGTGLRSRRLRLPAPVEARYLRLSAVDGFARVSEVAAWCRPPRSPQEVFEARTARRRAVQGVRFALAAAGFGLFTWSALFAGASRRRARDALLAILALAAVASWWNFGLFHFGRYVHTWEQFHYFLGAKYFPELGYDGLYACVTVADLEDGRGDRARSRKIRDMRTNAIVDTAPLIADPGLCRSRFDEPRWRSFKTDVAWFRASIHPERWERIFLDHGYNAPPAWGVIGTSLTRWLPASGATVLALALIDPILLAWMGWLVVGTFGWRAAAAAALWWGTNDVAGFGWTGGGLLRQDWLVLAIAAICLVRRGKPGLAGFALGWSTLLRVFPGFLVVALGLQAVARSVASRRWVVEREVVRFAVGSAAALAVLIPLSIATAGGAGAWSDFIENSRANVRSTGTNVIGLMAVLSYEHANRRVATVDPAAADPDARWLEAKRDVFVRRLALHRVLLGAFVVLLALAVRRQPHWAALALGIGLIPIASFVASYYYSILLGLGLLSVLRGPTVGAWLCALSMATHVGTWLWPSPIELDTRFAWNSLATTIVVVALTLLTLRGPRPRAPWRSP